MRAGKKRYQGFLVILLVVVSLFGNAPGRLVRAAPQPSLAQDNLVISEVRARGQSDDFVELFNPTSNPIDMSGWQIRAVNGDTGSLGLRYILPAGQQLAAGQHYLVAGSTCCGIVPSDGTFITTGLPANGGVALTLPDGTTVVDMVGVTPLSAEGNPLDVLSGAIASYERKPGGTGGSCQDTNSNATDFALRDPSDPQDLSSPFTPCPGPESTLAPTASSTSIPSDTPTLTATGSPSTTPTASHTATATGSPGATPSASQTSTATSTGTATSTATATGSVTASFTSSFTASPPAPIHLVISEFRTRGPNGADDEFVELYNPSGAAVNLGGWTVRRSASCASTSYVLFTIASGTLLQPGAHYLAITSVSGISGADQTFSASLADDGGLALVNPSNAIVDEVGLCSSSLYGEGLSLTPLAGNLDQSYQRLPGGSTACVDRDDNIGDFMLVSPSNPQGLSAARVMCAGVVTYTPTNTPTRTATRTATATTTTLPGNVVINEILPHPHHDWNNDGTANTGDEYIELINMGTSAISLKNWKLDNGIGGASTPYVLPDVTLQPHQMVLYFHADTGVGLSDSGSTVRLLKPDGRTADLVTYPLVEATDQTWCRLPDGDGAWEFICQPTPGKANLRIVIVSPTPTSTPATPRVEVKLDPVCLMNTLPAAIFTAECNTPGLKIWGKSGMQQFWLESRGKQDVFVE